MRRYIRNKYSRNEPARLGGKERQMDKVTVIGAGPGASNGLTLRAQSELASADRVYAARRHAGLVAPERLAPLEPLSEALARIERDWRQGMHVAVLVSGDTGVYSLLPVIVGRLGAENVRAVPGISALQEFCARLSESWQTACVLSAHGRALAPDALVRAVREHVSTMVFCDAAHGPAWICAALRAGGLDDVEIAVGERLSYPDERVTRADVAGIADGEYDALCMVRIGNPRAQRLPLELGLPDEEFVRSGVPMTKREVRALALAELRLSTDAVVWDVGAGTGSVSIECARLCPWGEVYAIERDEEALGLIEANARKFCVQNVNAVRGAAPEALSELPTPTHVFLGGCGPAIADVVALIEARGAAVRLVGNAVTLESATALMEALKRWHGLRAAQVAVNRIERVGRYNMFKAQNPVFVISADWRPQSDANQSSMQAGKAN